METATLVKANAQIARIVSLSKGDTYKRLEESSYGSDDKMVYGIVIDVLTNGDNTAIQVLEFQPGSYGSFESAFKTFAGGRNLAMFPAEPSEVELALGDAIDKVKSEVSAAQEKLDSAQQKLKQMRNFVQSNMPNELTKPSVTDQFLVALDGDEKEPF